MGTITLVVNNPGQKATPDQFEGICQDLLQVLIDLTPVDTGFCASQWSVQVTEDEGIFTNDADYAEFLDEGWSKQAPDGMTGPALAQLPEIVASWL